MGSSPSFLASFFSGKFGITERDLESYLSEALSAGGEYADLYFEYLSTSSIGIDEGIVKSASESVTLGVGIRVIAGERIILVGAKNQTHGRMFVGLHPVFAGVVAVKIHLAHVGVDEFANLEINNDKAKPGNRKR